MISCKNLCLLTVHKRCSLAIGCRNLAILPFLQSLWNRADWGAFPMSMSLRSWVLRPIWPDQVLFHGADLCVSFSPFPRRWPSVGPSLITPGPDGWFPEQIWEIRVQGRDWLVYKIVLSVLYIHYIFCIFMEVLESACQFLQPNKHPAVPCVETEWIQWGDATDWPPLQCCISQYRLHVSAPS
jgi:hypothetical protein